MRISVSGLRIAPFSLCVLLPARAARAQSYSGNFDNADCQSLRGWASDGNINDVVNVDLFDGTNPTPVATYPANQFRPDLSASYGWSLATPASLNDGQTHTIHARVHGNGSELSNSPRTFSCAYLGYFDGANPTTLGGWAWKVGVDTPAVSVDVFDSATPVLTGVPANRFRADLPGAGIGDGYHSFVVSTPSSVNDGQDHFLYTRISGPGIDLDNSPRLVTPNPNPVYQGYLDWAGSSSLGGWAEDESHPGNVLTVAFYDNGNPLGVTALANIFRQDVLDAGIGTGAYGFSVSTPASLLDGRTHNITAQIQGSGGFALSGGQAITMSCEPDPRRTGIYSTGSYWGGGGEQIDTPSGNLNFSLPLLTAQGRTGWTVPVALTYNSQNWRQENGVNLKLGGDVGYGFGWQMQIGSVTPYSSGAPGTTAIDHYVYADGTGAQYRLDVNNNGVWSSSSQSIYVWLDSSANRLHFRDGTFWVMGCTSSSGEADADTMYPTTVEDVNGNQVLFVYNAGAGFPSAASNTSARIATIMDVREPSGGVTYNFTYNSDSPVPHLAGITNYIQTAETFNFTYAGAAVGPPFGTDPNFAGQTTSHLATMNVPSTGNYRFTYDSAGAGELGQVTFPYGGHLRLVYQNFQYAGGRTLREVSARYLAADSAGATEWGPYTITHPDAANSVAVHGSTTLTDASGNGAKTWNFLGGSSPVWAIGLISDFAQKASAGSTYGITHDYYTWSQNAGGHPYISAKTSLMDEGTGNQQSALTTQAQDGYGNTTQSVVYPFSNTSTPVKTYNSSYLNAAGYSASYIFNRLLTTTLTTGGAMKTLVRNYYDGQLAAGQTNPNVSGCQWVLEDVYQRRAGESVSVVEPDPADQPGGTLTTSYTFDWMNHLSGVTPGGYHYSVNDSSDNRIDQSRGVRRRRRGRLCMTMRGG